MAINWFTEQRFAELIKQCDEFEVRIKALEEAQPKSMLSEATVIDTSNNEFYDL